MDDKGALVYEELICSGYLNHPNYGAADGYCRNAIDNDNKTSWRPQVHAPSKGEAWIGFKVPESVIVVEAYARGLGVGSGGGKSWDGGVALQRSSNGKDWNTIAISDMSDLVKLTPPSIIPTNTPFSSSISPSKVK